MPEFENLEPFFDQNGKGRPTPVAPHGEAPQDFEPRRAEGRQRTPRNRLRPKKVTLSESERISTTQMERDFKAALKEDKKRQTKRSRSPLRTLLRKIRSWFSRTDEPKKKPARKGGGNRKPGADRQRDRRGDGQGRPERRGKGGARKRGEDGAPRKGNEGRSRKKRRPAKNPDERRGPNSRPGNETKNRSNPSTATPPHSNPNPAKPANEARPQNTEPPAKKRRSRRNRNRRPPGDSAGPSAHEV